jgi:hypothetical protein
MTTSPSVRPGKEAVLVAAVEPARTAAVEVAGDQVGEHLGAVVDGERLVTHYFATTNTGYRGWRWAVTVARPPRGRSATVCEVNLLPGDGAILAPEWLPWSERLQPHDVGPTDVLPYLPDDVRLDQGYEATTADADVLGDGLVHEMGLGRARVLSREGRDQAVTRWYEGKHGPTAEAAQAAAAQCSTCGFFVKLTGSFRRVFGVCANEWSPDDGRVVSVDHGCGAHSETDVPAATLARRLPAPVVDELDLEIIPNEPAPGAGDSAS